MKKASRDPLGRICPDVALVFMTPLHEQPSLVVLLALDELLRQAPIWFPRSSDLDFAS